MIRTHTCGELTSLNIGEDVVLAGWVHCRRDHGGIVFVDLRDRYGITQIKLSPATGKDQTEQIESLKNEYVIKVSGRVVERPNNMLNTKLGTGQIEIDVKGLEILNESKTPPFELNEDKNTLANENLRLKYRFIDLRRPELQKMLTLKDKYIQYIRNYFQKLDFTEIQTPILANSSPEGARDFLIPSRLYPGKFYALPQAPQQFKQLLMVGGIDKYFQIAPCFRDEDPRMDRHYGEFYQLDMEMSFVTQEDIFNIMDPLMVGLVEDFSTKKNSNLEKDGAIKRIPWREALTKYGSDKPDLRFDMSIEVITDLVKGCKFSVFSNTIEEGGVIHAMKVEKGAQFSRKDIDELTEIAKSKKAKGLAYIIVKEDGSFKSPILKFLGEELSKVIVQKMKAKEGDIIFFGADKWEVVCHSLGAVRSECGDKLKLKDKDKAAWCWIVDFPMYSYSEINPEKIDFEHNPFSMPQGGLKSLEEKEPLDILAYQYDLVLNGFEVSSGAIRNHNLEIMHKAFEIAGYSKDEVEKRFKALAHAFQYGAPPHGGNAPGIDRLLMVLHDFDSIRDIYAFPKDGGGKDLMMDSPGDISEAQVKEANIKIIK